MKKIYVFDMGHVILKPSDLRKLYLEAETETDYTTFKNLFYHSSESEQVYRGDIDDNTFFEIIKNELKSKRTVRELKELYRKNKGGIYEDTYQIIRALKEQENMVCLLSNLKVIDYEYLCQAIDMNLFDKTFLSYLMHMIKPDKEIYESVIDTLGTNDFYFFDDTESNVLNACELGIRAYQVTGETIKDCFEKNLIKK